LQLISDNGVAETWIKLRRNVHQSKNFQLLLVHTIPYLQ